MSAKYVRKSLMEKSGCVLTASDGSDTSTQCDSDTCDMRSGSVRTAEAEWKSSDVTAQSALKNT